MLMMKPNCERCDRDLSCQGPAMMCSFECTFCVACAQRMHDICPNCGGHLVIRPTRSEHLLKKYPPSTERILNPQPVLDVEQYGDRGEPVFMLHGGPGATRYLAGLAQPLSTDFRVYEPQQRLHDEDPHSIDRHLDDLHQSILDVAPSNDVFIVGHSWGAVLALFYAASHPDRVRGLVLIGCGTLGQTSHDTYRRKLSKHKLPTLSGPLTDDDLAGLGRHMAEVCSVDPIALPTIGNCDARGHLEIQNELANLRQAGTLPDAFSTYHGPVLMLHGNDDVHPAQEIAAELLTALPQIELRTWPHCGHYPWLERSVRQPFLDALVTWLHRHSRPEDPTVPAERP